MHYKILTLEKKDASIKVTEEELKDGKLEDSIFELLGSEDKINFYKKNTKEYSMNNSAHLIKEYIKDAINAR